mmetsp:Transcript_68795/g.76987  ORF Transcript_68795/g.76987 Transcript_68795/m.76987 type:complete len:412 (+) Transcript_68795:73-1308(+)
MMIRFTSFSFLNVMFAISAWSSPEQADASPCDAPNYPFDAEWAELSANDTRAVYNVGIASLFNHASQQFQFAKFNWPSNQTITPLTMTYVSGVRREIRGCWRYHSARAVECDPNDVTQFCPPMLGAYFEVNKGNWKELRKRECGYDKFVPAQPNEDTAPAGYYFAWGEQPDHVCNPAYGGPYPDIISQSYFDSTIGGILAWDGRLTDSGRFTWDVMAELALGPENMAETVEQAPSLSWEQRYQYALDFVRSTAPSPDLPWMDDRKCPFTGDGAHPMTPISMLDFRHDETVYDNTCPKAIGGAAPLVSQEFHDLVDHILIVGGWGYHGANNTIDERYDPCEEAKKQNITRNKFDPNKYYDDVLEWRNKNSLATEGDVTACDDEDPIPSSKASKKKSKTSKKKNKSNGRKNNA